MKVQTGGINFDMVRKKKKSTRPDRCQQKSKSAISYYHNFERALTRQNAKRRLDLIFLLSLSHTWRQIFMLTDLEECTGAEGERL